MTISTLLEVPAGFYRGYELGNGLNDYQPAPSGNSPSVAQASLYGDRAILSVVGANKYWTITVDAFRFGVDANPQSLKDWWDLLIRNILDTSPVLATARAADLVFVHSKNHDGYTLVGDPAQGALTFTVVSETGLAVNDILFLYDNTQSTNRQFDVVKILTLPGSNVVTFESVRIGVTGLSAGYTAANTTMFKAEAYWNDCFLQPEVSIAPAEESSRGNFRKNIGFTFITSSDRLPDSTL